MIANQDRIEAGMLKLIKYALYKIDTISQSMPEPDSVALFVSSVKYACYYWCHAACVGQSNRFILPFNILHQQKVLCG